MKQKAVLLTFLALFCGCSNAGIKEVNASRFFDIELTEISPGEYLPFISAKFDGKEKKLILDTGAYTSSIITDEWSSKYLAIESDKNHFSQGASGVKVKCELIQIKQLEFSNVTISDHLIKRCRNDIFGLDLIGNVPFEIDYNKGRLNYSIDIDKSKSHKLGRMGNGHLTVKTKINNEEFNTILDTGATTTIVDLSYVKKHPNLFKLVKRDDGTDGHSGEAVKSYRYLLSELLVGDVVIKNVSIVAFDFPENMKKGFEGSPIMIGNNVLMLATWKFDIKNMLWQMTMYK